YDPPKRPLSAGGAPQLVLRRIGYGLILLVSIIGGTILWNQNRVSAAWYNAQHGLTSLQQGTQELLVSPRRAERLFNVASREFSSAVGNLKKVGNAGKSVFLLPAARDSLFILRAGVETAEIGRLLTKLMS